MNKKITTPDTYLLENDPWFWAGLEDWCKSFDPDFQVFRTDRGKDWMFSNDLQDAAMLSQPFVKVLLVSSAFESTHMVPWKRGRWAGDDSKYWQIEHYMEIIEAAFKVRQRLKYPPFEIHINYHGDDFLRDLLTTEKWGNDFSRDFSRLVRQQPELKVNIWHEYKFVKRITEKVIDEYEKQAE